MCSFSHCIGLLEELDNALETIQISKLIKSRLVAKNVFQLMIVNLPKQIAKFMLNLLKQIAPPMYYPIEMCL